jgi:hypothetical protein
MPAGWVGPFPERWARQVRVGVFSRLGTYILRTAVCRSKRCEI